MFRATQNKGFQMTFENNLTISVQFGKGNYCNNRNKETNGIYVFHLDDYTFPEQINECLDAEICIWDAGGYYFSFGNRVAKGWVTTDEVADWVYMVKNATTLSDLVI